MFVALAVAGAFLGADLPAVGGVAPDFSVKDTDGAALRLSDLTDKRPVALVFFPKAFTGG